MKHHSPKSGIELDGSSWGCRSRSTLSCLTSTYPDALGGRGGPGGGGGLIQLDPGEDVLEETSPAGADGILKSFTVITGLCKCGRVSAVEVDTTEIVLCKFWKLSKSSEASSSILMVVSSLMASSGIHLDIFSIFLFTTRFRWLCRLWRRFAQIKINRGWRLCVCVWWTRSRIPINGTTEAVQISGDVNTCIRSSFRQKLKVNVEKCSFTLGVEKTI